MMGASYIYQETPQQAFYRRCIGWEYKFVFWPTECYITGKKLWLEYAYLGCSVLTGPGDAIVDFRWHDKHEHLIWKLKQ